LNSVLKNPLKNERDRDELNKILSENASGKALEILRRVESDRVASEQAAPHGQQQQQQQQSVRNVPLNFPAQKNNLRFGHRRK